jgi:hypothetical protein
MNDDPKLMRNPHFSAAMLFLFTLVMAGCALLVGCQMNSLPDVVKSSDIRYFHDERTDICFAATNSYHEGYYSTTITYVPCTDKVRAIIGVPVGGQAGAQ